MKNNNPKFVESIKKKIDGMNPLFQNDVQKVKNIYVILFEASPIDNYYKPYLPPERKVFRYYISLWLP